MQHSRTWMSGPPAAAMAIGERVRKFARAKGEAIEAHISDRDGHLCVYAQASPLTAAPYDVSNQLSAYLNGDI